MSKMQSVKEFYDFAKPSAHGGARASLLPPVAPRWALKDVCSGIIRAGTVEMGNGVRRACFGWCVCV